MGKGLGLGFPSPRPGRIAAPAFFFAYRFLLLRCSPGEPAPSSTHVSLCGWSRVEGNRSPIFLEKDAEPGKYVESSEQQGDIFNHAPGHPGGEPWGSNGHCNLATQ